MILNKMREKHGFTLIEALVGLTIIAVLAVGLYSTLRYNHTIIKSVPTPSPVIPTANPGRLSNKKYGYQVIFPSGYEASENSLTLKPISPEEMLAERTLVSAEGPIRLEGKLWKLKYTSSFGIWVSSVPPKKFVKRLQETNYPGLQGDVEEIVVGGVTGEKATVGMGEGYCDGGQCRGSGVETTYVVISDGKRSYILAHEVNRQLRYKETVNSREAISVQRDKLLNELEAEFNQVLSTFQFTD